MALPVSLFLETRARCSRNHFSSSMTSDWLRSYLIDTENAVIVDVEATSARTYDEVAAARTMIDRTEERMGLKPAHLAADTAYGTGRFLAWVVARGIAPHIPVWDHSHRNDGTFSRDQFKFDKERNVYVCPMGSF
jgi:hypothetical protein